MLRTALSQLADVRPRLRNLARNVHGKVLNRLGRPPWNGMPNDLPWSDLPGARDRLNRERSRLDARDAAAVEQWIDEGWFVVDQAYDPADIDEVNRYVDEVVAARRPIPGLVLLGLRLHPDRPTVDVPHEEYARRPQAERAQIIARGGWRIHGLQHSCAAAMRMYKNERLNRLSSVLFGRKAEPCATITFHHGSGQAAHQDMAVFHIYPHNYLIGAWLALEDISPESGPLMFYPGSHHERMFDAFATYPQHNLRTCTPSTTARYYDEYVAALTAKYPRKEFLGKKGQVLLWHGMLLHGGIKVVRPELTRRSFVTHFSVPAFNRHGQVLGPFNW
jgi:hypothetical protein